MNELMLESDGTPMYLTSGQGIYASGANRLLALEDATETALRTIKMEDRRWMRGLDMFPKYLLREGLNSSLFYFWPITPTRKEDYAFYVYGGNTMQASGDFTWSVLGINGASTTYFNTKVNPSTDIDDINNFAFGIYITEESTSGYDFGAVDGSNYFFFSFKAASFTAAVGSTVDAGATGGSSGRGHWVVSVRAGQMYVYQNGQDISGPTAISGSFPNYNAYLAADNNAGTGSDFTDGTYSNLWIYNSAHSEADVLGIDREIERLQTNFYRGYGIS